MEHILKNKIATTFSRYSSTYDQYAKLQKLSAGFIVENIEKIIPSLPDGPILEIGCGSGMLTETLVERLSERNIVAMDISAGMLKTCKKRLCDAGFDQGRVLYVEKDAEKIDEHNKYALIVSGLTLQWFDNLAKGVEKIVNALMPGGIFVCSFLGDGSFVEWQKQCKKSTVLCTLNPLPDFNFMGNEFHASVSDISLSKHSVSLSYPSVHDFFMSLKKTGTGVNVSGEKNSFSEMRRLIKDWQESSPNGVTVTCSIHCMIITK